MLIIVDRSAPQHCRRRPSRNKIGHAGAAALAGVIANLHALKYLNLW